MHNWRSKAIITVAVPVLAITAAACGESGGTEGGGQELSGNILIDGSSTVAPLSEGAAELFMGQNPGVKITVGTAGTGGGFEKFCNGETDISDASRPIEAEETKLCDKNGVKTEQIAVANDALTVMVHKDNPVDCITTEQLKQIWEPGSKLKSWSEIDGLKPAYDEKLELYGPGTDSGTFDYFTEAINGEEGAQRTDYNNIGENDNAGITGVSGSKGGMFYGGYSYYAENKDKVKALEIDGGNGCVEPTIETVQDGSYKPLGRELYIYPAEKSMERPEVKSFVQFYVDNANKVAEAAGFISLTGQQLSESKDAIAKLTS
ncbi:MAG: phosphate ABC transporter substrate-binding protein PstS family protein [Actinophytocola sp.]|nr:phosphate ABC transporter substrate-binding protein PstS family protein [Actinophytocola sp.]